MKKTFAVAVLLLVAILAVGTTAQADQPSPEVVRAFQRYLDADTSCNIAKVVPFIVPGDLETYQRTLVDAIGVALEMGVSMGTFGDYFKGANSLDELSAMDSASFYIRCNSWLLETMPGLKEANRTSKTKLIGAVNQAPDKVYLVFRATTQMFGSTTSAVDVLVMRKIGSEWLRSLEGKTDKMAYHVMRLLMRQKP